MTERESNSVYGASSSNDGAGASAPQPQQAQGAQQSQSGSQPQPGWQPQQPQQPQPGSQPQTQTSSQPQPGSQPQFGSQPQPEQPNAHGYWGQPSATCGVAYGVPNPPAKKSKIPLVILAIVLALIAALAVNLFVSNTVFATKNIALIHIEGTIGQDSGANNAEGLLSYLNDAEQDDSVAAVVLRVDSGGGYSAQGEEMAKYVKDFSKPIVVSSGSTNASAAYFISSQADYIYANASSSVGSIGTIIQLMDYSDLLKMLGIDTTTIESSPSKDSSYGTRALTSEEIAYYQDQVDKINQVFIEAVSKGRNMSVDDVKKLATGMTFTGSEGVSNGLIDEVGTLSDACKKAASLAGVSHYGIVSLDDSSSYEELLKLLDN
jgi:protease IV